MPRLTFDSTPAEVAAATPAERAAWNEMVNAQILGQTRNYEQEQIDDRIDARIHRDNGEFD